MKIKIRALTETGINRLKLIEKEKNPIVKVSRVSDDEIILSYTLIDNKFYLIPAGKRVKTIQPFLEEVLPDCEYLIDYEVIVK
jgi:hypothetical protein